MHARFAPIVIEAEDLAERGIQKFGGYIRFYTSGGSGGGGGAPGRSSGGDEHLDVEGSFEGALFVERGGAMRGVYAAVLRGGQVSKGSLEGCYEKATATFDWHFAGGRLRGEEGDGEDEAVDLATGSETLSGSLRGSVLEASGWTARGGHRVAIDVELLGLDDPESPTPRAGGGAGAASTPRSALAAGSGGRRRRSLARYAAAPQQGSGEGGGSVRAVLAAAGVADGDGDNDGAAVADELLRRHGAASAADLARLEPRDLRACGVAMKDAGSVLAHAEAAATAAAATQRRQKSSPAHPRPLASTLLQAALRNLQAQCRNTLLARHFHALERRRLQAVEATAATAAAAAAAAAAASPPPRPSATAGGGEDGGALRVRLAHVERQRDGLIERAVSQERSLCERERSVAASEAAAEARAAAVAQREAAARRAAARTDAMGSRIGSLKAENDALQRSLCELQRRVSDRAVSHAASVRAKRSGAAAAAAATAAEPPSPAPMTPAGAALDDGTAAAATPTPMTKSPAAASTTVGESPAARAQPLVPLSLVPRSPPPPVRAGSVDLAPGPPEGWRTSGTRQHSLAQECPTSCLKRPLPAAPKAARAAPKVPLSEASLRLAAGKILRSYGSVAEGIRRVPASTRRGGGEDDAPRRVAAHADLSLFFGGLGALHLLPGVLSSVGGGGGAAEEHDVDVLEAALQGALKEKGGGKSC